MASCQIKIDSRADFEDRIYVHAHTYNPFLSGWGVVIDQQGQLTELRGSSHEDAPRLLLRGAIAALAILPAGSPVTIHCAGDYLSRWIIDRLPALRENDWRLAKKKANLDLVQRLHSITGQRPYLLAETAVSGQWPDQLSRAAELARSCGSSECYATKPTTQPRKNQTKRPAGVSLATVNPLDDVPWD